MGLTAISREIGGIFIPNFKKVRIKAWILEKQLNY